MHRAIWPGVTFTAALLILPALALAQTQRSGGGEAQKIMQQYQQVASEKAALQAEVEQSKKDLEQVRTELAGVKKERDQLKAQAGGQTASAAQLEAARAAAEKTSEQYKERLSEAMTRYHETAQSLKTVEAERAAAEQKLAGRSAAFDKCAEDNVQLSGIASDVLQRYEQLGRRAASNPLEPFTRITRTRIENLIDEYRIRAQELRVTTGVQAPK